MKKSGAAGLSRQDLRLALEFVHNHCAPDTFDRFIARALEGLFHLFPCIVANYGEVDPVRRTGSILSYPPEFASGQISEQALTAGFEDLEAVFLHRTDRSVRLSQLVNLASFRRTRMYREYFAPNDARDLLVLKNERSDGLSEFFSMFRQGTFSDRDQALLDAVAPALQAALTNARALTYLDDNRATIESEHRNSSWNRIILNHRRRILVESTEARGLLGRHFAGWRDKNSLPEALSRWVETSLGSGDRGMGLSGTAAESTPFSKRTSGKLLVARMLLHPSGYLLLLREEDEQSEWEPLTGLGLSKREAEVLNYLAMGKTGREIATILGISHDTVRKHTSRIFMHLRVETRTAAAIAAAEFRQSAGRSASGPADLS